MKHNTSILMLSLLLVSCNQQPHRTFTISGLIPGTPDSTVVRLVDLEEDEHKGKSIAETICLNGKFQLKGSIPSPKLCRIELLIQKTYADGKPYDTETETRLMLENTSYTIETSHLDSLPLVYEYNHSPVEKEQNVVVTGGQAQKDYHAYRETLREAELQAFLLDRQYVDLCMRGSLYKKELASADSIALCKSLLKEAQTRVTLLTDSFIHSHPTASISALLVGKKLSTPFVFTAKEMDDWTALLKTISDTARLNRIHTLTKNMKVYAKGQPFKDFGLVDINHQITKFSQERKEDVITLVDFWASWCGPCRASIPHLKQLYAEQASRLDIISVSVDKNEADWLRAMKEEQMPWRQFTVTLETSRQLKELYQLNSIPFFLLLDSDGLIVAGTHDPDEIYEKLKEMQPL